MLRLASLWTSAGGSTRFDRFSSLPSVRIRHSADRVYVLSLSRSLVVFAVPPSFRQKAGNKMLFGAGQHKVMVVGGPNERLDYHIEPGEVSGEKPIVSSAATSSSSSLSHITLL